MNVGPTHDGRIAPMFEERLRQTGDWLSVNGDAIYGTKPWLHQNDTVTPNVWYTSKETGKGLVVYAILLEWPVTETLTLGAPIGTRLTQVELLGYLGKGFSWQPGKSGGVIVQVPSIPLGKMPCKWAWVLKISKLAN